MRKGSTEDCKWAGFGECSKEVGLRSVPKMGTEVCTQSRGLRHAPGKGTQVRANKGV